MSPPSWTRSCAAGGGAHDRSQDARRGRHHGPRRRGGGLDARADGGGRPRPASPPASWTRIAEEHIRSFGGVPTFKGYRGFPGSICASPNDMIVHGIPGPYRLERGRPAVGGRGRHARRLRRPTPPSRSRSARSASRQLELIEVCSWRWRPRSGSASSGNRLGDVSHAVQEVVEARGFGVVRALVGHGVGRSMHEDPQIPNYGPAGRGPKLARGDGVRDRADDHGRRLGGARRRRRLGGLHRRRHAGRSLRAHGGDHRRRAERPHVAEPARQMATG